jgi:hypothetical protein
VHVRIFNASYLIKKPKFSFVSDYDNGSTAIKVFPNVETTKRMRIKSTESPLGFIKSLCEDHS